MLEAILRPDTKQVGCYSSWYQEMTITLYYDYHDLPKNGSKLLYKIRVM